MRAAVLDESGALEVRDWSEPEPGPGEVLVRVTRVGLCGSDVHFVIDRTAAPAFRPIVLGHEAAGVVERLGQGAQGTVPGTRVAIIPLLTCGECDRCLRGRSVLCRARARLGADVHGCWADLVAVPAANLVQVPDSLPDELAAVATDCVATAFHAARTRGGVHEGSRVAIFGAGGLGLSAVAIARTLGAVRVWVVDPRRQARQWALDAGADEALEPEGALERIAAAGGVDVALEFVGSDATVESAVRALDDGGRAVIVGVGAGRVSGGRLLTFVPRERELVGAYGAEPGEVREVVGLLASGALSLPHVVGDVIPLADVRAGLERVHRGDTSSARVVVAM